MFVNDLFHEDDGLRQAALAMLDAVPDHTRGALAAKLAPLARNAAVKLAEREGDPEAFARFSRTVVALAHLRVDGAKNCLVRLAEDESRPVKNAIARALAGNRTNAARIVILQLLSDDAARFEAIEAVRAAPWPEVLPALIELAEVDDAIARVAASVIALCGVSGGPDEANAAADFLMELLDDDALFLAALDPLVRHAPRLNGLAAKGAELARCTGARRAGGLALLAATGIDREASFEQLFAMLARGDLLSMNPLLHAMDASVLLSGFARARASASAEVRASADRTWQLLEKGIVAS